MARLYTTGFESGHVEGEGLVITGTPTFDTTTFRSGARALRCNPTAATSFVDRTVLAADTVTTWFVRTYLYIASAPAANTHLIQFRDSTTEITSVRLTTARKLQLFDEAGGAIQLGADSAALSLNTWYRVEVTFNGTTGAATARIDGVDFATGTGSASGISHARFGIGTATTADIYLDDIAVNDTSGASQTSYPGSGKVVALIPTSDPATSSANWVKPGGATTNRHTSVDNKPPVYETMDNTATSAEDYLTNAVSSAGDALELDTGTYTAAGIGASDTITLVQPVANTGSNSATDTAGKLGTASNPAIAVLAFTTFDNGIASATATTWPYITGTVTYAPAPTLGSACRLRVEKTTATTRVAIVNMVALLVEYVPSAGGVSTPHGLTTVGAG